jgi:epoxide hydrolase 4
MSATEDPAIGEVREGYAEVGDQRLHYVEAGEGPLVVLLRGFPEFWYGWRLQIAPLAAAGFRVVAPDMRGYDRSSKRGGVAAYDTGPADRRHPRPDPRTRRRLRAAGRS